MQVVQLVLGSILLLFGRPLYWVLVAIAGFLLGAELANILLADQADWVQWLAAAGGGILGTLVAIFAQRIAFALAGFYAGGYLAILAFQELSNNDQLLLWFLIGGIVGGIIAALTMDWAIILLSSLMGAGVIVSAFPLEPILQLAAFVLLLIVGVVVQVRLMRRRPRQKRLP